VAYVRCRNYHVGHAESHRLAGENHVGVNARVRSGLLSLLSRLRPELCRTPHRGRGNGEILDELAQSVQMGDSLGLVRAK
jgi:hypothetical protein